MKTETLKRYMGAVVRQVARNEATAPQPDPPPTRPRPTTAHDIEVQYRQARRKLARYRANPWCSEWSLATAERAFDIAERQRECARQLQLL